MMFFFFSKKKRTKILSIKVKKEKQSIVKVVLIEHIYIISMQHL